MKKKIFSLILTGIMSFSLALSSCQYILPKSVVSASLNEKGELILVYSDKTTQNVGVVKGEDGKDGQDGKDGLNGENGKDLTACEHAYGDWETKLAPSCTSIGYDTRVCSLCGDLDYQFTKELGHNYENPINLVHLPGTQPLANKTCSICGDTIIVAQEYKGQHNHNYTKNGICSICGEITHFIESDEYIEELDRWTYRNENILESVAGCISYRWWSIDRSYALILVSTGAKFTIAAFEGTPIDVILPNTSTIKNMAITYIAGYYSTLGDVGPSYGFRNCTTLKSIYIPDYIERIESCAFEGCTALESVRFSKNVKNFYDSVFHNCTALKKIYVPTDCYDYYVEKFKDFPNELDIITYS